jgi:hypothetical protein
MSYLPTFLSMVISNNAMLQGPEFVECKSFRDDKRVAFRDADGSVSPRN